MVYTEGRNHSPLSVPVGVTQCQGGGEADDVGGGGV